MEEKIETVSAEKEESAEKKRSLKRKKRRDAAKVLKKLRKERDDKIKLENPQEDNPEPEKKVKKNEEDIELNCRDCKQDFFFTKGEQYYYKWKKLDFKPSRCKECRGKKKQKNKKNDKRKRKVCKDWRNGNDRKGPGCTRPNCRFLHYEKGEDRGVCFAWKRGKCEKTAYECKFKHEDEKELPENVLNT